MARLTKGTQIYFIDPADDSVVRVPAITQFNPGGAPADQIEVTDLEELSTRQYAKGLKTPGQASGTVQADPAQAAHVRLSELAEDGDSPTLKWAIGWSDGTAAPTVDTGGNFNLPDTRTWFTFDGYVGDFPFDFQLGAVVSTNLVIQRSGAGVWTPKSS